MKLKHIRSKRKAISGIVAAVMLFAMLFTVGTSYFLYVNNANGVYQSVLFSNANNVASRVNEYLSVTTLTTPSNHIGFFANNTGGLTANLTAFYLLDQSGNVVKCGGVGVPGACTQGSPFPLILNVGKGIANIPTTKTYVNTTQPVSQGATATYTLKVMTARGNVFSATYPPTATALASQALSSGAIGDIYIQPQTFTYYYVCTSGSGTCTACAAPWTSCYLQKEGPGFTVPTSGGGNYPLAWGVTVVDYNPNHFNVTLDSYTLLMDFFAASPSNNKLYNPIDWYIVSTSGSQILGSYSKTTLSYGIPYTLYFSSGSPGAFVGYKTPVCSGNNWPCLPTAPSIALVFLLTHGCEAVKTANCGSATYNYGQNSPYVSTEYT